MCAWLPRITAMIRESELYPLVPTKQWWSSPLLLYGASWTWCASFKPMPMHLKSPFSSEVDIFDSCRCVIMLTCSKLNHLSSRFDLLFSLWWCEVTLLPQLPDGLNRFSSLSEPFQHSFASIFFLKSQFTGPGYELEIKVYYNFRAWSLNDEHLPSREKRCYWLHYGEM